MTGYRIFPLDQAGHVAGRKDIDVANEAEAFVYARQALRPATPDIEVWVGTRCIGRVSAASAPTVFFTDNSFAERGG